jgi:hypothetical protein
MDYRLLATRTVRAWVNLMLLEKHWDPINGREPFGGWPFRLHRPAALEDWLALAVIAPTVMHDNCDANVLLADVLTNAGLRGAEMAEPHWSRVWDEIPRAAARVLWERLKYEDPRRREVTDA